MISFIDFLFHNSISLFDLLFLWQYDAFDIGFITTDDFTNADILEATYPAVAKRLNGDWVRDPAIPIVTGFLGKVFYNLHDVIKNVFFNIKWKKIDCFICVNY